jgi:hypothetical protein
MCFSGGDDFEEVDEDENIDELDQQEVRTFPELPLLVPQDGMGSDTSLESAYSELFVGFLVPSRQMLL